MSDSPQPVESKCHGSHLPTRERMPDELRLCTVISAALCYFAAFGRLVTSCFRCSESSCLTDPHRALCSTQAGVKVVLNPENAALASLMLHDVREQTNHQNTSACSDTAITDTDAQLFGGVSTASRCSSSADDVLSDLSLSSHRSQLPYVDDLLSSSSSPTNHLSQTSWSAYSDDSSFTSTCAPSWASSRLSSCTSSLASSSSGEDIEEPSLPSHGWHQKIAHDLGCREYKVVRA